ncbi:MAG: S1 RNA-binding domain-containing protein [Candidatus Moraniibacteriota bacterium]
MSESKVFIGTITDVVNYSVRVRFDGKEGTVHVSKFPEEINKAKNLKNVCKRGDRIKVRVSPTGNNPAILECVEFPVTG